MDTKTLSAYEKHKPAIYKWRENNKEKYNDICNKAQTINHEKNILLEVVYNKVVT